MNSAISEKLSDLLNKFLIFFKRPEGFFLITGLVSGLIFLIIIPPLQTPDEYIHFYRAYEVSELKIPSSDPQGIGSYLPKSIIDSESRLGGLGGEIRFSPRSKYDIGRTKAALLDIPLEKENKSFYQTSSNPLYFPLIYLPQAVVVALMKVFNTPVVLMLYMLRISNLALWLICAYIAIKIFPWKKWSLVGVCLLPVVVAQSISPGLDVITFSSSLLFISLVFNIFANGVKISRRALGVLLFLAVTMVFAKSVTVFLLPIVIIIKPKAKDFNAKEIWLWRTLIILLPILLYMLWGIVSSRLSASTASQSSEQMHLLLTNPFRFIALLSSSVFFIWGDPVTQSMIGNFGWMDTPLSAPIVCMGYIFIAGLLFIGFDQSDKSANRLLAKRRKLLIFLALCYFVSTYLAMFIYSTLPSDKSIIGVQGRYFIPLLFLLIPTCYNTVLIMKERNFISFIKVSSIVLISLSALTIFFRYYINYF